MIKTTLAKTQNGTKIKKLYLKSVKTIKMNTKFCCICDKDCEKSNSFRQSKSYKHKVKTSLKTKSKKCEKVCNTELKSHECQLKIDKETKRDVCSFYIKENN